jgi:Fe-S cluster assembly protein SufB
MSTELSTIERLTKSEYKYGFTTDIATDVAPKGLNEDIIRLISAKKNEPEFMLEWRLKAFRYWQKMTEPKWPNVHYPPIDYQNTIYYAAPKSSKKLDSLDEVDPKLRATLKSWVFRWRSKRLSAWR